MVITNDTRKGAIGGEKIIIFCRKINKKYLKRENEAFYLFLSLICTLFHYKFNERQCKSFGFPVRVPADEGK